MHCVTNTALYDTTDGYHQTLRGVAVLKRGCVMESALKVRSKLRWG